MIEDIMTIILVFAVPFLVILQYYLIKNIINAGIYAKKVFALLEQEMGPLKEKSFEGETPDQIAMAIARAKAAQYLAK